MYLTVVLHSYQPPTPTSLLLFSFPLTALLSRLNTLLFSIIAMRLETLRSTPPPMLADLNVPWPVHDYKRQPNALELQVLRNTIILLHHLGYTHVAINFAIGHDVKIVGEEKANPIDLARLKLDAYPIKVYTRITILVTDPAQCHGLAKIQNKFDLVSLAPQLEKALIFCAGLDIDIITFDSGTKLSYFLKHKTVCAAIERGIKMELCYGAMILGYIPGGDSQLAEARKNFFYNALQLIRLLRSRGVLVSLGAQNSSQVRSSHDILALLKTLGLDRARAKACVSDIPEKVLINGRLRIKSYKQTVVAGDNDFVDNSHEGAKKVELAGYKKRALDTDSGKLLKKLKKH